MYHALDQRMSINLCWPFLKTLDFSCRPYPQFVSESHEFVVLLPTLVLLSSLVGNLEPNIDISSLAIDWVVSLVFDDKTSIHTLGFIQCLGFHYPYWWFPLLCLPFSLLAVIQRVFFMYRLHLEHVKDAQGHWFMNMFFI
jgi:hypothetical protein